MLYPIKYPDKYSEFEVQSELYSRINDLFNYLKLPYKVRGEVKAYGEHNRKCYFDLAVFDKQQNAVMIIEVKDSKGHKITGTYQHKRYKQFGVPIIYCLGHTEIEKTIDYIINKFT